MRPQRSPGLAALLALCALVAGCDPDRLETHGGDVGDDCVDGHCADGDSAADRGVDVDASAGEVRATADIAGADADEDGGDIAPIVDVAPIPDASIDAEADAAADAAGDGDAVTDGDAAPTSDAGSDSDADTTSDASSDSDADTTSDASSDSDADTASDTGAGSAADTTSDAGPDGVADAASDAGSDTAVDTASDAAPDTAADSASDAGADSVSPPPTCKSAKDCPASPKPCHGATCVDGACQLQPLDLTSCSGGPCTGAAFCSSGSCVALPATCPCDKDADCQALDDGDACTGVLLCKAGFCLLAPPGPVACGEDDVACTSRVCDPKDGACKTVPLDGYGCDDGNPCSAGDVCKAGVCTGDTSLCPCKSMADCATPPAGVSFDACSKVMVCDALSGGCVVAPKARPQCPSDGNPCTVEVCDPKTGSCTLKMPPFPAGGGIVCDDGNPCTHGDHCDGKTLACVADQQVCKCFGDADCQAYSSGGPCGGPHVCELGVCKPGKGKVCSDQDGNSCTVPQCDAKSGACVEAPVGGVCDDGNACTGPDICVGSVCKGDLVCGCKAHSDCKAVDPCLGVAYCKVGKGGESICAVDTTHAVVCDASADSQCVRNQCSKGACKLTPVADGKPCSDGLACSGSDACKAGLCLGDKAGCACLADADCKAFDDGNPCTGTVVCAKDSLPYVCKIAPSTVPVCLAKPSGPCKVVACDPKSGGCVEKAVADGSACVDGDACTTPDVCVGGACKPGKSICACKVDADCPGSACGSEFCQESAGALVCKATVHAAIACNDGDPCTDDSCVAFVGCKHAPAPGKPCDDGDKCTSGDSCQAGVCAGKPGACSCKGASDCAGLPGACRKWSCGNAGVCTWKAANDDKPCDDGDPCTPNAACKDGSCDGGGTNICVCTKDAHCADNNEGNLCSGTHYCDLATHQCKLDPATVVICPKGDDTACLRNICDPKDGACKLTFAENIMKKETFAGGGGKMFFEVPMDNKWANVYCDDGDPCTPVDACDKGACVAASPVICPCQKHSDCKDAGTGDACLGPTYCAVVDGYGTCKVDASRKVVCPGTTAGPCLVGGCNQKTGACGFSAVKAFVVCDDGDPCTALGSCDPSTGLCSVGPKICACTSDADCKAYDDGNPCNGVPHCDAKGLCSVDPATVPLCKDAFDPCAQGCDAKTGACSDKPKADGSACNDGDPCTTSSACSDGKCVGAGAGCCKADTDCTDWPPLPEGSCGIKRICAKGVCGLSFSGAVSCPAGGPCELASCDATSQTCKLTPKAAGSACKANGACFAAGACDGAGQCQAGAAKPAGAPCSDGNACTSEACDGKGVCVAAATAGGSACSDGDACTSDACDGKGTCAAKPNPACTCGSDADCKAKDDGNVCNGVVRCMAGPDGLKGCQIDPQSLDPCKAFAAQVCFGKVCDPALGCKAVALADGTPCGDGLVCKGGGACVAP